MAEPKEMDVWDRVTHAYANNDGVKIHYVTLGNGNPIIMIHGFPDFWYTWRDQMAALSEGYQVVAIDQRGYNKSDKPQGVDHYALSLLVADVAAVIRDLGKERAIIVCNEKSISNIPGTIASPNRSQFSDAIISVPVAMVPKS